MQKPSLKDRLKSSSAALFDPPKIQQTEVVSGDEAQARFSRFTRAFNMNPKGFRQASKKHGPPRAITAPDRLLIAIIGSAGMPSRTMSDRKKKKAERYVDYLAAVKANPSKAGQPGS